MADPLVSVVIPVRNAAAYIGDAIASVLAQGHRPLEVIVVDDGSTDESVSVARAAFPDVKVVAPQATGIGAARNRGVEAAQGELIGFLDADDLWTEDKLAAQLRLFEAGAEIAGGKVRNFKSPELSAGELAEIEIVDGEHDVPIAGAVMLTRQAWQRVGPFSETLRAAEMLDWTLRYRRAGIRIAMVDSVILLRRLHLNNTTRQDPGRLSDYAHVLKQELDRRRGLA